MIGVITTVPAPTLALQDVTLAALRAGGLIEERPGGTVLVDPDAPFETSPVPSWLFQLLFDHELIYPVSSRNETIIWCYAL